MEPCLVIIGAEAIHAFHYKKYVKEFEIAKKKLQSKTEDVLDRVNESKKKIEKVVGEVKEWLYKSDSLMARMVELQEKLDKRNKLYCLKYFPNLIRRYDLSKKILQKIDEVEKHCQIEFTEFAQAISLEDMNHYSSQGYRNFESRHAAYNGLVEALKDDKIQMIGLYGMEGCGKTSLAKEVLKEVEQSFEKFVFVDVSNTIDVRKIQGEVASQLSLEFKTEEELERARHLFLRLNSGERILIILDDVWEKLDLEAIGIPVTEHQTGCTILITTRKIHICRLMNCEKIITLEGLNEEEAWALFHENVGTHDNCETLKGLTQEITKMCNGLPGAIVHVARALKEKPQIDWEQALKTVKDSISVEEIEEIKG